MSRSREIVGECAICGTRTRLTKEHIPQKRAFNDRQILMDTIDKYRSESKIRWKQTDKQAGHYEYTLCGSCNNNTGSWYGDDYVKFIYEICYYATERLADQQVDITLNSVYPLRIAKQALAYFCSICGPSFTKTHSSIRKLILDRNAYFNPYPLKLFLYIRATKGARMSGITGVISEVTGGKHKQTSVVSELSWWPIGWILTFMDQPDPIGLNVTSWFSHSYNERCNKTLQLPCLWAETAYPLDNRSPDQVIGDLDESSVYVN